MNCRNCNIDITDQFYDGLLKTNLCDQCYNDELSEINYNWENN